MNGLLVFIEMKQKKKKMFWKKNSKWPTQKNKKNAFFACFWAYVGQPHKHISWATPMPMMWNQSILLTQGPNHKNFISILRIGGAGQPFWFFFQGKKNIDLKENKQPIHMRYHFFLQYGWFLQNLGKGAVWTNMHTTQFLLAEKTYQCF